MQLPQGELDVRRGTTKLKNNDKYLSITRGVTRGVIRDVTRGVTRVVARGVTTF